MPQYQNDRTGQCINLNPGQQTPYGPGLWRPSMGAGVAGGQYTPPFPTPSAPGASVSSIPSPVVDPWAASPLANTSSAGYVPASPGQRLLNLFVITLVFGFIAWAFIVHQNAVRRDEAWARIRAQHAASITPAERKRNHDQWLQGQAFRKREMRENPHAILSPNPPEPPK